MYSLRKRSLAKFVPVFFLLLVFLAFPASSHADVFTDAHLINWKMHYKFADKPLVLLDDPTDTLWTGNRWFFIHQDIAKEGLATAISAASLDRSVYVAILGSAEEYQLILQITINEEGKVIDP